MSLTNHTALHMTHFRWPINSLVEIGDIEVSWTIIVCSLTFWLSLICLFDTTTSSLLLCSLPILNCSFSFASYNIWTLNSFFFVGVLNFSIRLLMLPQHTWNLDSLMISTGSKNCNIIVVLLRLLLSLCHIFSSCIT